MGIQINIEYIATTVKERGSDLDDPEDLAKEMIAGAVSETASKVLESKIAINLLNPVAVEVGKLLGDVAGMIRFYASDNLARIFTRWAEIRKGKPPLKAEEFKRVMPMLQMASMQSDEELQNLWAILLEAEATNAETLPSFAHTLSQITPEEARFLDHLWTETSLTPTHGLKRVEVLYESPPPIPPNEAEMVEFYIRSFGIKLAPEPEREMVESLIKIRRKVTVMVADFERLGIIHKQLKIMKPPFPGAILDSPVESSFAYTSYGTRFMKTISEGLRRLKRSRPTSN